jgi:hypothetical protein
LARLVRTRGGVEAVVVDDEALNRLVADNVGGDDFLDVIFGDMAVPDGVGINDDSGSVLALVEASGLVGADGVTNAVLGQDFLELLLEFAVSVGVAAATGMVFGALVGADKDVLSKLRHISRLQQELV